MSRSSPSLSPLSSSSSSPSTKCLVPQLTPTIDGTPSNLLTKSPAFTSIAPSAPIPSTIPPLALQRPQQEPVSKRQNHSRSYSAPGIKSLSPISLPRDSPRSSSSLNALNLRQESYSGVRFPKSPRLRPLMSPGPVTPIQLEEDSEYRFLSNLSSTSNLKRSPLIPTRGGGALKYGGAEENKDVSEIELRKLNR
jgi:hypothetical protein